MAGTVARDITSCRAALDFLKNEGELIEVDAEIDPVLEVSGVTKALDDTRTLLFNNVKGYPGARIMAGMFSRGETLAKLFGAASPREVKLKGVAALKSPVPPQVVDGAPCQEVVMTRDIDVPGIMPITKYTASDPGRILGGGIVYISGPEIGHCVSYKRMHFRAPDWASMTFNPGGHFEHWVLQARKAKANFPCTINICPSPAVMAMAGGGGMITAIPAGADELGIAGGLQEAPVRICKARTVDAYSLADAEWVIEGYTDTSQVVWESDEAEKRKDFSTPFFPEAHGHQGRALTTYKFVATAITHRKERPVFYAPIGHSFEYPGMMTFTNDAILYDTLNRIRPGLVLDVNSLPSMMGFHGTVIQVKKERRRDDEHIGQLILNAFSLGTSLRMVMVVDEDVDIYDANDVMWALIARVNPGRDIMMLPPSRGFTGTVGSGTGPTAPVTRMGINATAPFDHKWQYFRGEFPAVDLGKWFGPDEVAKLQAIQSEYARTLARKRV